MSTSPTFQYEKAKVYNQTTIISPCVARVKVLIVYTCRPGKNNPRIKSSKTPTGVTVMTRSSIKKMSTKKAETKYPLYKDNIIR
jgi:hypothetical protein